MSFRVLVLHSSYLSGAVSGENRVVQDEVRLLRERGHDVVAWTPSPSDSSGIWAGARQGMGAVWSSSAARPEASSARDPRPQPVPHALAVGDPRGEPLRDSVRPHPAQLPADVPAGDLPSRRPPLRGLYGPAAVARRGPPLLPGLNRRQRSAGLFPHAPPQRQDLRSRVVVPGGEPIPPRQARPERHSRGPHRV